MRVSKSCCEWPEAWDFDGVPYAYTETVDRDMERVERRECWVITEPDCLDDLTPRRNGPN